MFYRYSKFELKILLLNRKQLFLGLLLILFFPIYFQLYLNTDPPTLLSQKSEESEAQSIIVNTLPLDLRDTEEGMEIFDNYTEQLSIVKMQIYYLSNDYGRETSEYITEGLRLNDLRLKMHEQDNPHVSSNLTIPREEIDKENEYLTYLQDHNIQEEDNPFVTSQFMMTAMNMLSGIFLFAIILLICSDIMVYENDHQSVLRGMPVTFGTKALSKVALYFTFITGSLILGVLLGTLRSGLKEGFGNFSYPTLIYTKDGFLAVSIMEYSLYVLLGMVIAVFMTVLLSLLLNVFVTNMYGVALAGFGLFFLPDLLYLLGIKAKLLFPIKYIDVTGILSGDLALQFGDSGIHYWNSVFGMLVFSIVITLVLYVYNWLAFRKRRI